MEKGDLPISPSTNIRLRSIVKMLPFSLEEIEEALHKSDTCKRELRDKTQKEECNANRESASQFAKSDHVQCLQGTGGNPSGAEAVREQRRREDGDFARIVHHGLPDGDDGG